MSDLDAFRLSYLVSRARRRKAERIRARNRNIVVWCGWAMLFIATTAILAVFPVYHG